MVRTRDLAQRVGITERAVQRIVADLVADQYVVRQRIGRRNRYGINYHRQLRHPVEDGFSVSDLLRILDGDGAG